MINHARTLLLNYKGQHLEDPSVPGDVYIPPFEPVELSTELQQVHNILFWALPDYLGLTYRSAQFMGILHSTEYSAYIFEQDPRITYDPDKLTNADSNIFGTIIRGPDGLHVNGTWATGGSAGRVQTIWRVVVKPGYTVKVDNITDGLTATYLPSDVKPLIGSDLVCTIDDQARTIGATWYITNNARPAPELPEILATLKDLPLSTLTAVFGQGNPEPYKTFRNLFNDHYAFAYRLSGFLLAFIRRLEDIRKHVI